MMLVHMMNVCLHEHIVGAKNKSTVNNCLMCNGHKLKCKKLHFNMRKSFFTLRVALEQAAWQGLETFPCHLL